MVLCRANEGLSSLTLIRVGLQEGLALRIWHTVWVS